MKIWPKWSLVFFKLDGKVRKGMITKQGPMWSLVYVHERWPRQRVLTNELLPLPLTGPDGSR